MAEHKIAEFFAKLTFKFDTKDIDGFEKNLRNLEHRIMALDKRLTGKFEKIQKGFAQTQMAQKRQLAIEIAQTKLGTEKIKQGMANLSLKEKEIKTSTKQARLEAITNRGAIASARQKAAETARQLREQVRLKNWANNAELRYMKQQEAETKRIAWRSRKRVTNVGTAEDMAYAEYERRGRVGRGRTSGSGAFLGAGLGASAMGWGRGFIPGLGGAFAVSQLNSINQELIGQQIALNAVTGSPEAGKASMDWVKNMSQTLGISYRTTTPSYTKMLASGKNGGFNESQVRNVFEGLAQYGRVLNLDSESMKGTMRGVEQIFSKGQVMSEELKGQIAERMPGAVGLMAKAASKYFGEDVDTAKLMKLMEDGKVPAAVLTHFGDVLKEEVKRGGQLEEAMKSSAAQQQRFNNAFSDFVSILGKSGFDSGMSRIFKSLADMLQNNKGLAEGIGKAWDKFSIVVEHASKSVSDIYTTFKLLNKEIPYFTEGLAVAFAAGTPLGRMISVVSGFLMIIQDIFMYIADPKADTVMGRIFGSEDQQTRVIAGVAALGAELLAIYGTLKLLGKLGGTPDLPDGKSGKKGLLRTAVTAAAGFIARHPVLAIGTAGVGAGIAMENSIKAGSSASSSMEAARWRSDWVKSVAASKRANYEVPSIPTPLKQPQSAPLTLNVNVNGVTDLTGFDDYITNILPKKMEEVQRKQWSMVMTEYPNK